MQNFLNGLNPAAIAIVGTISGAIVGSLSAVLIAWVTKRYEERKHYRDAMLNAAIQQRRQDFDNAVTTKRPTVLLPLEFYLSRSIQLDRLLQNRKLTEEQLLEELKRLSDWSIKAGEYYAPFVTDMLSPEANEVDDNDDSDDRP